ncbi:hypothetical protein SAMN05192558_104261 [Actinokineospora alba]|uniref:Uncharacterized protein n=1 Tax=Actinokineospora alba TaxID=504798 RepID=A0A1H0LRW8_9PSEU|nr:hypothetical protein [Actinokineospora alba]TDP67433.1 hypothetical protein C8E96_2978 [Actinokineospora alba]SDI96936.1 hypothetical protein SAMN05421871_10936 [Actinokineospora alba]SDO70999.1 hypothetical protein SAMN05192558_104261 [Actinokineospora alba]
MTSPEEADLAANLVCLAVKLDTLAVAARQYARGLILEWTTPENAQALAAALETAAQHVRAFGESSRG